MARTRAVLPGGARLSDYLSVGGVAKVFPLRAVRAALRECGRAIRRKRALPAEAMVYSSSGPHWRADWAGAARHWGANWPNWRPGESPRSSPHRISTGPRASLLALPGCPVALGSGRFSSFGRQRRRLRRMRAVAAGPALLRASTLHGCRRATGSGLAPRRHPTGDGPADPAAGLLAQVLCPHRPARRPADCQLALLRGPAGGGARRIFPNSLLAARRVPSRALQTALAHPASHRAEPARAPGRTAMMRPVPTAGALAATRGGRPDWNQAQPRAQGPEAPCLPPRQHQGEMKCLQFRGLMSVLRVEQLDLQAGILQSLVGRLPEDAGALDRGRGDGVPPAPPGRFAQPLGQRAELPRGAQRAVHAGLAQPHGGLHLHLVGFESRDAGTEDLQGVGVEMVRHGPGGHGDGLCHHHLTTRRKRGGRRPLYRPTAERSSRFMVCPLCRQGSRRTTDVRLVSGDTERRCAPGRFALRSWPASADPTLARLPDATAARIPPCRAAVRMRKVPCRRGGRDADHERLASITQSTAPSLICTGSR